MSKRKISSEQQENLLKILKKRFEENIKRHQGLDWSKVETKLKSNTDKMWSLQEMENTGGEPDLVLFDQDKNKYIFMDCAAESPKGRRSLCYDRQALEERKEYKPKNSAMDMAAEMGIEMLDEAQYKALQKLVKVDTKTSSWLKTPADIRDKGGAIFGDFRYGHVFIYHNGVQSYYAARGFRGALEV